MELLDSLVTLEPLEDGRFRGYCQQGRVGRAFGGHVAAHAQWAGCQDAPEGMQVSSLHVHFLRPGDPDQPFTYTVTTLKRGRSLCLHHVEAVQDRKPVLTAVVSLHHPEPGPDYQDTAPAVPAPEEFVRSDSYPPGTDPAVRAMFDYRYIDPEATSDRPLPPIQQAWLRSVEPVSDDPVAHAALLTYASDLTLTRTAHMPLRAVTERRLGASLDHVMWFHHPSRVDGWLLFDQETISYGMSRALSRGRVFDRSGRLVASVAQEALIRLDDAAQLRTADNLSAASPD